MYEDDARNEKRVRKIISKAAQMAAVAVGLLILSFMLPLLNESEVTKGLQSAFSRAGIWLLIYSVVIFTSFAFLKQNIMLINAIMQYIFLPSVGIVFAMDLYEIFGK